MVIRVMIDGKALPGAPGQAAGKRLHPPRGGGLVLHYDAVQETGSPRKAFLGRKQGVLVLDGEHVVVPEHAQRGGDLLPPPRVMAVAARAVDRSEERRVGKEGR